MRKKILIREIAKKLEGMQTIDSISKTLKIKKRTATNLVSKLKKQGHVEYYSAGRNKRIYRISPITIKKKIKGYPGLYGVINKHSKIKVAEPYKHYVHGKKLGEEEALVLALNSQKFRLILASLSLFTNIKNWRLLNEIAKKNKVQRKVGALYDVTRLFIRTRKMDERTRKSLLKGKGDRYIYKRIKTKDFFDIAKRWRVEIPFKKEDLIRLRTG